MDKPPHDPQHWLWRLDARAWCQAAARELESGDARVASRRTAVTHARRAAGMALNGVLVALGGQLDRMSCETRWGRSYIDHLRALASASPSDRAPMSAEAAEAARELMTIGPMPERGLVQLQANAHGPARRALELARSLVRECERVVVAAAPA